MGLFNKNRKDAPYFTESETVKFDGVSKAFEDKQVLSNLSFTIKRGEKLCIMGESGCGKTTVVNLLLRLFPPDSGTIAAPDKISVVFQEDRLFEDFSVMSNVMAVAPKGTRKEHCAEILEGLRLADVAKKPVKKLSGGMQRRVAIARLLTAEAKFYILDEPFKGLDNATKETVVAYVKRKLEDKTLLLITHNEKEAELLGITEILKL